MDNPVKSSPAPWRAAFVEDIRQMSSQNYILSTLHRVDDASSTSRPQYAPRCRNVVHRGMWASLPPNPKNTASRNPDMYESDLLTITTDVRMEKITELFESRHSGAGPQGGRGNATSDSGEGGPVEAVFWVEKTGTQWRIQGRTFVIGPDIDSEEAAPVRTALASYLRKTNTTSSGEEFVWSRELTAHFGNLSPAMRGSFRNPPPGTPRDERPGKVGEGLGLGQKVEDLHDEVARSNFRVVVIVPEEVDRVDLSDPANHRRWKYRFQEAEGWETSECWP